MDIETRNHYETKLRNLIKYAWEREVDWAEIDAWQKNFNGLVVDKDEEQIYALFTLSRFMYFGKRLVREMLKSVYREHFRAPIMQRIRRNYSDTLDMELLEALYQKELRCTRFIGVGNPAESGAHLLYFFRQINYLPKDLFVDITGAFIPRDRNGTFEIEQREPKVSRYIFFDDLVGSGDQATTYLRPFLDVIKKSGRNIDLRFISLFSTSQGLQALNKKDMFNGNASCLFELDESYKVCGEQSRYFTNAPSWFKKLTFYQIFSQYGQTITPDIPLGYGNSQLLLGFSHNTPDNTLPVFWYEGKDKAWSPVFIRYDKKYGL